MKTAGAPVGDGAPRALTQDDAQAQDVETLVASRVERFLQTHTVKIDLKGSDVLNAVSSAGRALGDAADNLGLTDDSEVETGRKKSEYYFVKILRSSMSLINWSHYLVQNLSSTKSKWQDYSILQPKFDQTKNKRQSSK